MLQVSLSYPPINILDELVYFIINVKIHSGTTTFSRAIALLLSVLEGTNKSHKITSLMIAHHLEIFKRMPFNRAFPESIFIL